jgi:hypothetical protein
MAKLKKAKIDPKIRYQWHPQDGKRCGLCSMFVPPDECTDVVGQISRFGWCKIFARKKGR